MPPRPSPLGDFIRRQRERQALTLRQLSEASGISNPYLSQIERGLREPSDKVVEAIARTLDLSLDAVYEQAGLRRGDDGDEGRAVIEAIEADPRLTPRRRKALIEVYEALATAPPERRRPPA